MNFEKGTKIADEWQKAAQKLKKLLLNNRIAEKLSKVTNYRENKRKKLSTSRKT